MIKASELRIGNIVWESSSFTPSPEGYEEIVVGAINDIDKVVLDSQNNIYSYDYLYPIPLTPEWLRKFGFTTLDAETDIEVWGFDDESNGEEFSIVSDGIDTQLPLYFEYDLGYRNVRKEIKHVHQLQNLYFSLTGEELTIKE